MKRQPRVYIPQQSLTYDHTLDTLVPRFDLEPAARFGELVVLLPSKTTMMYPAPLIEMVRERLDGISPDDYFLPVGDPVMIGIVAKLALDAAGGRLTFLRWDRREGVYIPVRIDINQKELEL